MKHVSVRDRKMSISEILYKIDTKRRMLIQKFCWTNCHEKRSRFSRLIRIGLTYATKSKKKRRKLEN